VIFPANAGTLSAFGILHSDLTHDLVRSHVAEATPAAIDLLAPLLRDLVAEAGASLDADAVPIDARRVELCADMRYRGQAFELTVPLAGSRWDQGALVTLLADFHSMHRQRFSYADPGAAVEIVSLRAAAIGRLTIPAGVARARSGGLCRPCKREVRLDGAWQRLDVWRRDAMAGGHEIRGPAIIEEDYTTLLITAGWTCLHRDDGHLIAMRDYTDLSPVMAGLVTASRVYSTCGTQQCGPRTSPRSDAIHDLVPPKKGVDARDKPALDDFSGKAT
jgi:N-methylhydantoinase A/oxoprolinase/acetone carboxylase beta subunit